MNILNKLVRGELSLAVTFWIFFISIRFILKNIFGICYTLFFADRIPATPFFEILLVTSIIDYYYNNNGHYSYI